MSERTLRTMISELLRAIATARGEFTPSVSYGSWAT